MKTLHIATTGIDTETVVIGIKNFPIHKLALICFEDERKQVEQFTINLEMIMKIPVEIYTVKDEVINEVLFIVSQILEKERSNFDEIIVNVAGGNKHLTCAGTVAAFVHGLKAFHVRDKKISMLPIMKLSYRKVLSHSKIEILQTIASIGGQVESLTKLSEISGYGKSLISHHIFGSEESRGLADLGLVEVERHKRGRIKVSLTILGRIAMKT